MIYFYLLSGYDMLEFPSCSCQSILAYLYFLLTLYTYCIVTSQLIFSIKSQGGTVVASATLPECKIIAGSKRYFIYEHLFYVSILVSSRLLLLLSQRIGYQRKLCFLHICMLHLHINIGQDHATEQFN